MNYEVAAGYLMSWIVIITLILKKNNEQVYLMLFINRSVTVVYSIYTLFKLNNKEIHQS